MYKANISLIIGLLCLSTCKLVCSGPATSGDANQEWELVTPQKSRAPAISRPTTTIDEGDWPSWFSRPTYTIGGNPILSEFPSFVRQPDQATAQLQPVTITKTVIDENGNRVTHTLRQWGPQSTTHTVVRPTFTIRSSADDDDEISDQPRWSTTTPKSKSATDRSTGTVTEPAPTTSTTAKLPTLQDFLEATYGRRNDSVAPTSTTTMSSVDELLKSTTPHDPKKPVTNINLEDIPVTQIYNNGKPVDQDFVNQLPKELRPTNNVPNTPTVKVENVPRREMGPNVRTVTKTITLPHIPNTPTASNLGPDVRNILDRAGITPEDIENEDTIVRTRTEPDGRVVTTTYKRTNSVDVQPTIMHPVNPIYRPPSPAYRPSIFNIPSESVNPFLNFAPSVQRFSQPRTIDEMLSRLGLNVDEHFKNGECIRTLTDNDGRVLTATFVLSTIRPIASDAVRQSAGPIKRFLEQ